MATKLIEGTEMETAKSSEIQQYQAALIKHLTSSKFDGVSAENLKHQSEIVLNISPQIHAALELGASFDQIADLLLSEGLKIGGDTLRELYYQHHFGKTKSDLMGTVKEVAQRFQESLKKNLADIVRLAVDEATARNKGVAPTTANGSGGGGGPAPAASQPAVQEGKKINDTEQQSKVDGVMRSSSKFEAILRRNIDPRDIPRRAD